MAAVHLNMTWSASQMPCTHITGSLLANDKMCSNWDLRMWKMVPAKQVQVFENNVGLCGIVFLLLFCFRVLTRGEGECAYLSDIGISSARDYTSRKWICSKSSRKTSQWPETSNPEYGMPQSMTGKQMFWPVICSCCSTPDLWKSSISTNNMCWQQRWKLARRIIDTGNWKNKDDSKLNKCFSMT